MFLLSLPNSFLGVTSIIAPGGYEVNYLVIRFQEKRKCHRVAEALKTKNLPGGRILYTLNMYL
jgi:hypothetical protein